MTTNDNSNRSWQDGYGPIRHNMETIARVETLLARRGSLPGVQTSEEISALFSAADRLASAAMWLVAHMTYASRCDLSGADLPTNAFKSQPEGHTGGSLNMVIAFVGYLTANILSAHTRAWVLGQGHCVAAIEAINTLIGDVSPAQSGRYDLSEAGLSRLVSDFYSYAMTADGRPGIPLGSHVGPHTAGGISEGGYLGFTEVQYVHMPLRGERLVAFLSDGAFEEQRGSDWSPRWWRAEDCGLTVPVMILNGRRIEQRTEIGQDGGSEWLLRHLRLNGFDPVLIDGHDPVAFAVAILDAEARLVDFANSKRPYPAPMPYIVAQCIKGFGFAGAGTNLSHNLPLAGNPHVDAKARADFHKSARNLFVPRDELIDSIEVFNQHGRQNRLRESQNPLANRCVSTPQLPEPDWKTFSEPTLSSPMGAIDSYFVSIIQGNPHLRVRVGNPDELRSNRMGQTLDLLKHRVNDPEHGTAEAVDGSVITALNEEAVIGAALGNKGGINLAVSYEAFAMKMLGALRQDIIFSRHKKEINSPPGWLSVPLVVSSHTWENAKNEQSHQDPTLPEALLGEMSDTARVFFPVDSNSAAATLREVYHTHGNIACLVVPKRDVRDRLSGGQATQAVKDGAICLVGAPHLADIQFVAIGAYHLNEAMLAYKRLKERGIQVCVTAILEPGKFREGRDHFENEYTATDAEVEVLFPRGLPRVILSHTRPEPMLGVLRRLDGGPTLTKAIGYINQGGTLDIFGMLFANKCTWAHALNAAALLLKTDGSVWLTSAEQQALDGRGTPVVLSSA